MPNLMKIRPVGAQFHADKQTSGRTDKTKLTVFCRGFAVSYENVKFSQFASWRRIGVVQV